MTYRVRRRVSVDFEHEPYTCVIKARAATLATLLCSSSWLEQELEHEDKKVYVENK